MLTFTAAWGQAALADQYTIPLLVPAGTSSEPQGVLRILNGTNESRDRGDLRHRRGFTDTFYVDDVFVKIRAEQRYRMEEPSHEAPRFPERGMRRFKSAIQ